MIFKKKKMLNKKSKFGKTADIWWDTKKIQAFCYDISEKITIDTGILHNPALLADLVKTAKTIWISSGHSPQILRKPVSFRRILPNKREIHLA